MLHVAMITPNLSFGGAERWVVSLIRHTDSKRIHWTGTCVSGWGGLEPSLCRELSEHCPIYAEPKIEKTAVRGKPTPASISASCEQYLQRVPNFQAAFHKMTPRPDIVVAWGSHKYRDYLRGTGIPHFVFVSHSSHHKPQVIDTVPWCRTHLAAVSEVAKQPIQSTLPITVIYNGVPVERVRTPLSSADVRSSWGWIDGINIIGYVGRQSAEKNFLAAAQALTALPGWGCVYFGPYPAGTTQPAASLQALAAQARGRCKIYGPTTNVGEVYRGIDVLMLASKAEAFSLTLIEAWLARVPVVATPVGCIPELEKRYNAQLVIPVPLNATPEQLAEACKEALTEKGRKIASTAYYVANKEFTVEVMANNWMTYLENCVVQSPPRMKMLALDL